MALALVASAEVASSVLTALANAAMEDNDSEVRQEAAKHIAKLGRRCGGP